MKVLAGVLGLLLSSAGMSPLPAAPNSLRIDGSLGMLPLAEALAEAFSARLYRDIPVRVGKGMPGGKARLSALAAREIDIALSSRIPDSSELAVAALVALPIATAAVVVGVQNDVPLNNVSATEACAILGGSIPFWALPSGESLAVRVFLRPESEVDMEVLRSGLGCMRPASRDSAGTVVKVMGRPDQLADSLAHTPGAVGVTTLGILGEYGGQIRALSIDGGIPDEKEIRSGCYPLTRPFILVMRNPPGAAVSAFCDFVRSKEGAAIIRAFGAVPLHIPLNAPAPMPMPPPS